ncbi:Predicted ATPase [Variovorax sp. HW608]|uniref:AAA family ATPase n=1 Tax=Variovorax sp. HW608 TaxID=1034889 RepID=UPI00081F7A65|nr:AAA family ATPase [Variovorax sp. HW608]SCK08414.1 Predicted ATPase [Variovorax sp. HW608]
MALSLQDAWPRVTVLRRDGEFVLSRRAAERDADTVLVLEAASDQPAPRSVKRLKDEFALSESLDPRWAAKPITLTQERGRSLLVLSDPGGEPLSGLLRRPWNTGDFLRAAIGMAVTLGRVHAQGLIHKDVKPDHFLIDLATGEGWLTGFGIASRLTRERQAPDLPETIAGSLAYMAPEQTGRMNRSVDARSDLYSLGATFYELLTGERPFTTNDPMELIHCHVARQPVPPVERSPGTPAMISAIVVKLLSKTPEERYQTAAGVAADLHRCLSHWKSGRIDEDFALGLQDLSDRLLIPEKLYGREREVKTLLTAFDRVVRGGPAELVLVSGYSGIGKSSVVSELQKVLVPSRGLYASGKFDQYKRNIPYSTLAKALQTLVRDLLGKSDVDLAPWRDALREALGPNGRLVTELVPDLTPIIGEQPPAPDLSPQDARGRFQLVFRRFIGVFAQPEHPLALFLDDLQWLDAATLDLVEDLLTQPDVKHLLLIGAYRDNEVDPTHPLVRKLNALRQAGALVQDIVLAPLTREDMEQLVAESLHSAPERAGPLAKLVHGKTTGNPFFAIQFISSLFEEGLISFEHIEGRWAWDLDRIDAKGYSDNVVDLIVGKLAGLVPETQDALKQLACLGNTADFGMLNMVYPDSMEQMHAQLEAAAGAGFIMRSKDSYHFLHDRVQEAAYSLIPEELRAETHLRIGMVMASHTQPDKIEEGIFEIVNQFNRGLHLISSMAERERIAALNLTAGRRAKASTAYASALKYLRAGRGLLTDETWNHNHALVFSIECLLAECELLTAELAAAENRLSMLAGRAKSAHEVALVTRLRLTLHTGRADRAVEVFLEYMKGRGTDWSAHPTEAEVLREYERIWSLLGDCQIEDLVDLPLMTDPNMLDVLDVLTEVSAPALFTDVRLLGLVLCRMVNLSLKHGNSDASCYAYVWLGMLAGPHFGNYQVGFRLGKLGYDLVEERGLHRHLARTYLSFGTLIVPWTRHIKTAQGLFHRTFDIANRIGDLIHAGYSCNDLYTSLLAAGDPLAEVQREAEKGLEFATNTQFGLVIDIITVQLALIRTLRGSTGKFGVFNDERFDEFRFERHLATDPALVLPECWYWIRKIQARFLAGDYPSAIEASVNAKRLIWTSPSFFEAAEFHYYSALSRAATLDSATGDARQRHLEALSVHQKQQEVWVANCPENFENRVALVGAEIARIEGREFDAARLYEKAIRSARENDFVNNEGLAYELAARFYLARGFEDIGILYLQKARNCYRRWGADGKVRQLEEAHPGLREEERAILPTNTIGASVEGLDLATVIKVSQALSSEIALEKMIDTLMRIAIEHAGAGRGLLILARHGEHSIVAEVKAVGGSVDVQMRNQEVAAGSLPQSVYHYVMRTHESVILDDAAAEGPFASDSYIRQQRARSVLCLPLLKQTALIGVLYLENPLAARAFTPARFDILNLLASQAAIALESARLYADLQKAHRLEAMGTLAGGIAHDFNNILGAILGYGEMALRQATVGTRLRRDLEAILAAGERGRALVERVLAFSRSGGAERVAVHVEKVVHEALNLLSGQLTAAVRLEVNLSSGKAALLGDATQVHQVVMNLGTNAAQAMPSGGVLSVTLGLERFEKTRAVTIGCVDTGDYIVLRVADTGSGIPAPVIERMFEPFFTTKEAGAGTGLGLSLVHGIVTQLGGAIDVVSTIGKGSTFAIYLPRSGDATDSENGAELNLPGGQGQCVMVVDDEEALVALAARTLEELGYVAVGFSSSTAALAAFRADPQRFDAVITDERMPQMSGGALIGEVRGIRNAIPIVLMSGYIGAGLSDRARVAGADEVLKKPLRAHDLATSLARVLGH